ncbi:MAG: hypothetical protein ACRDJ4_01505 [Actinomycetota bacterium]
MRRAIVVGACVGLLWAAACRSGGDQPRGGTEAASRLRSSARIEILAPDPGQVVQSGKVAVRLELVGGRLSTVVSTDLAPDVGHIHLRLDGKTVTLLGSLEEHVDVSAGAHVLEAEFVAADHGPFNPRVIRTVAFRAQ